MFECVWPFCGVSAERVKSNFVLSHTKTTINIIFKGPGPIWKVEHVSSDNLGQNVIGKLTKLSKTDFPMESFVTDFS